MRSESVRKLSASRQPASAERGPLPCNSPRRDKLAKSWVKPARGFVFLQCWLGMVQHLVGESKIQVSFGQIRIKLDGTLIFTDRF